MFLDDRNHIDKACIIHNNHILTVDGKVHRFKETGLWGVDNTRYYSNTSQRYIMYGNPTDFGYHESQWKERSSLITAMILGKILNRIVILPKFHCYGCDNKACKRDTNECAFNAHFHVKSFNSQFANRYRENVFLKHPKVPNAIKNSVSPVIRIVKKNI